MAVQGFGAVGADGGCCAVGSTFKPRLEYTRYRAFIRVSDERQDQATQETAIGTQRLTAHAPSQPTVSAEAELPQVSADRMRAVLARAHEAGRELGQCRTDAYGIPVHAVPAPAGSARVQALLRWEASRQAS
jgi:hypothetical protein